MGQLSCYATAFISQKKMKHFVGLDMSMRETAVCVLTNAPTQDVLDRLEQTCGLEHVEIPAGGSAVGGDRDIDATCHHLDHRDGPAGSVGMAPGGGRRLVAGSDACLRSDGGEPVARLVVGAQVDRLNAVATGPCDRLLVPRD